MRDRPPKASAPGEISCRKNHLPRNQTEEAQSRETPRDAPLALLVRLDHPAGLPEEAAVLHDAVREFFVNREARLSDRLSAMPVRIATRWE